jgi:MFS transporter, FSR family, fosmidomycin resistance protein
MASASPGVARRTGLLALALNPLLLAVTFGHGATDVFANLLPMLYPLLMRSLELDYGRVGLVGTLFICTASLSQPFFGYLADRVPTRFLAAGGIAWISVLMGLVGFAWSYTSLIALVCLAALGNGAFHPQGAMNAALVSGRQRASGVSIFLLGGTVGFAIAPLIVAAILSHLGAKGALVMTVPGVLAAIVVWTAMRRHEGRERGEAEERRANAARNGSRAKPVAASFLGLSLLVVVVALRSWPYQAMTSYIPLLVNSRYAEVSTASMTDASGTLFAYLAGAAGGMLGGGLLADRIGRTRTCVVTLFVTAPAIYLFLQTSGPVAIVLAIVAGFMIEASHPVTVVMAQEMLPRSTGLASGLILGLAFVAGGIGAFFTGLFADRWTLYTAMASLAIFPVAAAVLCLALYRVSPHLSTASD